MRKFLKTASAVIMGVMLLCSCGGKSNSDVTASELLKAAEESGASFDEMESVTKDDIKYYYELEEGWYDDFAAEISGNQAYADEIVVVKASSSENVKKVSDALKSRIESRKTTLQSYAPEEYDKLCKSSVETKGNYVYLVVNSDIKTAQKALEKLF